MSIPFLIIGAQKGGSTTLHHLLLGHPEIHLSRRETSLIESPFWERGGPRRLQALLDEGAAKKAVGLKRPYLMNLPECPERIREHLPGARLLAVLRDPIDRALSAYYHYMRYGDAPVLPPEEGITALLEGRLAERYPKSSRIIEFGHYHRDLQRLLETFDRDEILVLLMEDLIEDPVGATQHACRFIGVDDGYVPPKTSPKNVGVYALGRIRIIAGLHRGASGLVRAMTGSSEENPGPDRFVMPILTGINRYVVNPVFPDSRPPRSEKLVGALREVYREGVLQLANFLERPLDHWRTLATDRPGS